MTITQSTNQPANQPASQPGGQPATPSEIAAVVRASRPVRLDIDRGITTAEYAVGTAAGAGLAGLLYKLLTGGFGNQLLHTLFDHVLALLGI